MTDKEAIKKLLGYKDHYARYCFARELGVPPEDRMAFVWGFGEAIRLVITPEHEELAPHIAAYLAKHS